VSRLIRGDGPRDIGSCSWWRRLHECGPPVRGGAKGECQKPALFGQTPIHSSCCKELAKLRVAINEEKSRMVDLSALVQAQADREIGYAPPCK
jgi:hypothetical protein